MARAASRIGGRGRTHDWPGQGNVHAETQGGTTARQFDKRAQGMHKPRMRIGKLTLRINKPTQEISKPTKTFCDLADPQYRDNEAPLVRA
jgi:hypothetical protein